MTRRSIFFTLFLFSLTVVFCCFTIYVRFYRAYERSIEKNVQANLLANKMADLELRAKAMDKEVVRHGQKPQ